MAATEHPKALRDAQRPVRASPGATALAASILSIALLLAPSPGETRDPPVGGRSTIVGPARVVDGATLEVGETRVRLAGIETPPPGKSCRATDGRIAACHLLAADALREVVRGNSLTCTLLGPSEPDGIPFALCQTREGVDVGTRLIRKGWARVGTAAPETYLETEMGARRSVHGLWRGQPW